MLLAVFPGIYNEDFIHDNLSDKAKPEPTKDEFAFRMGLVAMNSVVA